MTSSNNDNEGEHLVHVNEDHKIPISDPTMTETATVSEKKEDTDEEKKEEVPDFGGTKKIKALYGKGLFCYMFFGMISSLVTGAGFTLFGLLFKELLDALIEAPEGEKQKEATIVVYYFIGIGAATLIFSVLQYGFFGTFSHRIGIRVRNEYFRLILHQEISYFDAVKSGGLNDKLLTGVKDIENGIGPKLSFQYQQLFSALIGAGLAFYYSWKMTLVLIACLPALMIGGFIQGKMFAGVGGGQSNPYTDSTSFSYDCFMGIDSIKANPSLKTEKVDEYNSLLEKAYPTAIKRATLIGFGFGLMMLMMFGACYSIGLWYGATLVDDNKLDIGDMFGCFFSFLIAGMALGQMGSVAGDLKKAELASNEFLQLKNREINIRQGTKILTKKNKNIINGDIEFKNVAFSYDNKNLVLDNINFKIESGKHYALCGPSGSGKSTIISLLMRFYDPIHADTIRIDNQAIENYDLEYLRENIGYVAQLPLLFNTTIMNNIRGGNENLSDEDIYEACKQADCYEFITKLENGFNTIVGEMGNKLSGGQKQRISIARAIVTKPSILLFDESTSALDTKSEKEVQKAIDKIAKMKNQTIITIAHRLSTIKNCDCIIVLVDGEIDEMGTHDQLITNKGVYNALVQSQALLNHEQVNNNQNGHNNNNNDNNNNEGLITLN